MVVIWPSVDVYVSVEYESRWQRFRYGSKGEISIVPPLGSEPCSLMQTLQALRTFVKSEPAAHNWLFNPSAEAIAKASSNDGILALNPVESRTRSLDKCFTTYCRDQSTQRVQSRHYLTVQRGFWTKPLMLYGSSICVQSGDSLKIQYEKGGKILSGIVALERNLVAQPWGPSLILQCYMASIQ